MDKELLKQEKKFAEEDEIDLLDLLKIIYKNRKMIVIIVFVITVLGIAFALLSPRAYTSQMTFVEETSSQGNSGLASMAANLPLGMGSGLAGSANNLLPILESRTFKEK